MRINPSIKPQSFPLPFKSLNSRKARRIILTGLPPRPGTVNYKFADKLKSEVYNPPGKEMAGRSEQNAGA
jgi:hypothetical protein